MVEGDSDGALELSSDDVGFAMSWFDSNQEQTVTEKIAHIQDDSAYARRYKEAIEDSFGSAIQASGGQLNSISSPRFSNIGAYKTVYVQADASTPDLDDPMVILLFEFDCAPYACQAMAFSWGPEPFSEEQWSTIRRVIRSVDFLE